MKLHRYVLATCLLAVPTVVMAGVEATDAPGQPQEQPQQPEQQEQLPGVQEGQQGQQGEQQAQAPEKSEVKGAVLPMIVGTESATMASSVLHELATEQKFERKNARRTAKIASEAIEQAHDQAEELAKMKGLSDEAQRNATLAKSNLKEAKSTIKSIERKVGMTAGMFDREESEEVKQGALELLTQVADARVAIDNIAQSYQVSTDIQPPALAALEQQRQQGQQGQQGQQQGQQGQQQGQQGQQQPGQ